MNARVESAAKPDPDGIFEKTLTNVEQLCLGCWRKVIKIYAP